MAKRPQAKRRKNTEPQVSRYRQKNPNQTLRELSPKTDNQRDLITAINTFDQTFVFGPAGTGKTFVPVALAAQMLDAKEIGKIICTRPNVAAGPTLGLRPGDLDEKLAEWIVPVVDVLSQFLGAGRVENDMKSGKIEFAPLETMRGRTFDNAFVLLDEAQNVTAHEIEMFLTRIGMYSKIVVNGDISQSDLPGRDRGTGSGLARALQLVAKTGMPAGVVEFGMDDCVRSPIAKAWVKAFWEERETRQQ